jgi:hypothetical protein
VVDLSVVARSAAVSLLGCGAASATVRVIDELAILVELPDSASTKIAARIVAGLFRVVVTEIGAHILLGHAVVALTLQGRICGTRTEQENEKSGDYERKDASIGHVLRPPEK